MINENLICSYFLWSKLFIGLKDIFSEQYNGDRSLWQNLVNGLREQWWKDSFLFF